MILLDERDGRAAAEQADLRVTGVFFYGRKSRVRSSPWGGN